MAAVGAAVAAAVGAAVMATVGAAVTTAAVGASVECASVELVSEAGGIGGIGRCASGDSGGRGRCPPLSPYPHCPIPPPRSGPPTWSATIASPASSNSASRERSSRKEPRKAPFFPTALCCTARTHNVRDNINTTARNPRNMVVWWVCPSRQAERIVLLS